MQHEPDSILFKSFLNEHHIEQCNDIWLANQPPPVSFQALSVAQAPIMEDINLCFNVHDQILRLREDEAKFLSLLIQRHRSSTVTYDEIIEHVWGKEKRGMGGI